MKNFSLKLLVILACFSLSFSLIAQNKWGTEWKYFNSSSVYDGEYTEKNKLWTNYVRDVAVAHDGTVWFAVSGRILLYKDKKMTSIPYKRFDTPRYINNVEVDSKGDLWVGTSKGLYHFNHKEFKKVEVPNIKNVTELKIDKNDNIYVAGFKGNTLLSGAAGLSVYKGGEWKNYNPENSGLTQSFVEDITIDNDGKIWMVAGIQDNGVTVFDGTNWTLYDKTNSGLKTNIIRAIEFDSKGVAWFGTHKGLVSFDGESWEHVSLKEVIMGWSHEKLSKLVSEPELISITIDYNDVMWIGTEGNGIIKIDGENKSIMKIENSPITSNYIRNIHVDHMNRKWFLTGIFPETWTDRYFKDYSTETAAFTGAIMYQDPVYDIYDNWKIYNTFSSTIPTNSVYQINQAPDGTMWMGCPWGLMNFKDNEFNLFKPEDTKLLATGCIGADFGPNGEIRAASGGMGVGYFEGETIKWKTEDDWGLSSNKTKSLLFDDEGALWIVQISGLDRFKDGKTEHFDKKTGLMSNNIFNIRKDSKGRIWVCTTKGISVYDKGTWTKYDKKKNGLAGYIYDVVEDKDGVFWAGGGKGLYKLEDIQWVKATAEGMPRFLNIKCMEVDKDGVIWIGTHTDYLYSFDGNEMKHYNSNNSGVIFRSIYDIYADNQGQIWISMQRSQMSTSTGAMPNTTGTVDPNIAIRKKIKDFEPKASLVVFTK
jgi:ligand-binding sensor domain-containing protein